MRSLRVVAVALAAAFAAAAPAAAQQPGLGAVSSPNVEHLLTLPLDVGMTAGATIVDKRLYVTSAKNLTIYDISNPALPVPVGGMRVNIAWENEEVPTNGKILAISNDFFDLMPSCVTAPGYQVTNCLQIFDVRDPSNIKEVGALPQNGDHTSTCILDCQYLYGSAGSITDLRGVLDGAQPRDLGSWRTGLSQANPGTNVSSCHHVRELRPGVVMTACQPYVVMSVLPEHGGSITHPKVLVRGGNSDRRFVHSIRWPREGQDRFALQGGETNFTGRCGSNPGSFAVIEAAGANQTGQFGALTDQVKPANGTYADGHAAANPIGCSVHWFQEHETFRNGGLVALGAYEDGVRFLQVTPEGKLVEQGWFVGAASSVSSPKWVPGTDIVYSIDYLRGLDVLRWKGEHYVPDGDVVRRESGRVAGVEGRRPAPRRRAAAEQAVVERGAAVMRSRGWQPGICILKAS